MLNIEKIINDFEQQLKRELTPEERHLLRLAFDAYPPCEQDQEGETLVGD